MNRSGIERILCPVCGTQATGYAPTGDGREFDCPRCGPYWASGTILRRFELEPFQDPQRAYASSWIRERPQVKLLHTHEEALRTAQPPPVGERATRVFLALARRHVRPGEVVNLAYTDPALQSIGWAVNEEDLYYLVATYLVEEAHYLLTSVTLKPHAPFVGRIAPKGWVYIEAARGGDVSSDIGFVAMWFNVATDELRERGLKPAVELAGYRPLVINEVKHNNPIDAEIIATIRRRAKLTRCVKG